MTAIPSALRIGALLVALGVPLPVGAVNIEYVAVRDAGNAADTPSDNCFAANCGSVDYDYAISKHEITNSEYVQFLNEVANEVDTFGLYNPMMKIIQIIQIIQPGFERFYVVQPGFESKPVVWVSFWDALRFANWLHNGQPRGLQNATTTEDGAYTITPAGVANNLINRNFGATHFLPSESEWYKAAYYDPALPGYYDYPAGTDTLPTCAAPGATPNTANCGLVVGAVTDVGSYTGSASPYGTFDQGGNVWEWNEQVVMGSYRGIRGGSWSNIASDLAASSPSLDDPTIESSGYGFRVATLVPEPAHALLVLTGGLVLAVARRHRRAAFLRRSRPASPPVAGRC